MRGVVESVSRKPYGSVLASDLSAGDDILEVESAADFPDPDEGGTLDVTVGGQTLTYDEIFEADEYGSGVTVDTLHLVSSAIAGADMGTNVVVPGKVRYVAQVRLGNATLTEPASLRHGLRKARQLKRAASGLNIIVECQRDEFGDLWVTALLDEDPSDDGAAIADETLALSTAADPDDLADQNFLSTIARAGSAYGVPLDNPIITALNADGDGLRWDGPGAFLSLSVGNAVQMYLSATRAYLGGETDLAQYTALVGRIRTLLTINPGAAIQLLSQQQPPEAPTVAVGWPTVGVLDMPHFDSTVTALWYRASTDRYYVTGVIKRRNSADWRLQMWSYDADGGDKTLDWEQPLGAFQLKFGIARVGSSWFFLVQPTTADASTPSVQERDSNGVLVNQWPVTTIPSDIPWAIGSNAAGNLLVIWDSFSTSSDLQTYATTGGAPLSTLNLSPGGGLTNFVGSDTYDFGATRIVSAFVANSRANWVWTDVGVEHESEEWSQATYLSGLKPVTGAAWNADESTWFQLATDGTLYRYTALEQTAGWNVNVNVSALVTLRDGSGNETNYDSAKVTSFTTLSRQQIVINAPTVPPGSGMRYCLYLAKVASPTRTDFHLYGTPASGDNSWTVEAIPTGTANPPSTNTMPSGTSEIRDAAGVKVLASDNTGSVWDAIAAGGGGGTGGIDIDCGDSTAAGVDIDCGGS